MRFFRFISFLILRGRHDCRCGFMIDSVGRPTITPLAQPCQADRLDPLYPNLVGGFGFHKLEKIGTVLRPPLCRVMAGQHNKLCHFTVATLFHSRKVNVHQHNAGLVLRQQVQRAPGVASSARQRKDRRAADPAGADRSRSCGRRGRNLRLRPELSIAASDAFRVERVHAERGKAQDPTTCTRTR